VLDVFQGHVYFNLFDRMFVTTDRVRRYRYLVQILPALVIGPQYFAGKLQLGVISQ
jgi:hypothetical protein